MLRLKTVKHNDCLFFTLGILIAIAGCRGTPSETPVSGQLTINGQPIENVLVRFHPVADPENPEVIAQGITDAQGHFSLSLQGGKIQGAAVGQNIVTLTEGPVPEKIQQSDDPLAVQTFLLGLQHRPLPVIFQRHVDSSLKVDVVVGGHPIQLEINDAPTANYF